MCLPTCVLVEVGGLPAESAEDDIPSEDVERTEKVFDGWMAENCVPEDVKHVVAIVCKRKGMDYGIIVNDR